jgi:cytochrome b pre-mRNA-processing protein 3
MFAALLDHFRMTPEKRAAADLYDAVVAAARQPALYQPDGPSASPNGGVADSVDGRFDMIALHAFLLFHRMSGREGWQATGDALANHIMKDMDRSLREMGVGDMTVGKKMKALAQAFYGRLDAYWGAVHAAEDGALAEVLVRNVYRDDAQDADARPAAARVLSRYVRGQIDNLAPQSEADILAGRVTFAPADSLMSGSGTEPALKDDTSKDDTTDAKEAAQ